MRARLAEKGEDNVTLTPGTSGQFDVRIDHTLTEKDQLFGRYSFQNTGRHEPPILNDPVASGDFASDIFNRGQSFVTGWSRAFGSSVFNEFRASWNKVSSDSIHPAFGIDANALWNVDVPRAHAIKHSHHVVTSTLRPTRTRNTPRLGVKRPRASLVRETD